MSIGVLKSICVDFSDESLYQYITVFSEEIYSRTIEITPLNNGEEYTIPAGTIARLEARKPDNKPILIDSKIDFTNNKIYIELTPRCIDTPGITSCQIGLYGIDNRFIASSYFYIDVYRTTLSGNGSVNCGCDNNVVESSPEYQSFRVALLSVDEVQKRANMAIEQINENAENANQATASANEAAERANTEAKKAENAALKASSTEEKASENENTRIAEEQKRIAEENNRISSEETRKGNENVRAANEEARISAEAERVNNEKTRIDNENIRVENEGTRQALHEEMKTFFGGVENVLTNKNVAQELGEEKNKIPSVAATKFVTDHLNQRLSSAEQKIEQGLNEEEITKNAISATEKWLDEHPEATTTVQDSSLTEAKFSDDLKLHAIKDYVTPEMFKMPNDVDDTESIKRALSISDIIYFPKGTYVVSETIVLTNSKILYGAGETISVIKSSATNIIEIQGNDIKISNLGIHGNGGETQIGIIQQTQKQSKIYIENIRITSCNKGVYANLIYLASLRHVYCYYCTIGFEIIDGTSTTLDGCYACTENLEYGYIIGGVYMMLTNCCVDQAKECCYKFLNAKSVTMIGCGAESFNEKLLVLDHSRGVIVANLSVTTTESYAPNDSMVILDNCNGCKISNIYRIYYNYALPENAYKIIGGQNNIIEGCGVIPLSAIYKPYSSGWDRWASGYIDMGYGADNGNSEIIYDIPVDNMYQILAGSNFSEYKNSQLLRFIKASSNILIKLTELNGKYQSQPYINSKFYLRGINLIPSITFSTDGEIKVFDTGSQGIHISDNKTTIIFKGLTLGSYAQPVDLRSFLYISNSTVIFEDCIFNGQTVNGNPAHIMEITNMAKVIFKNCTIPETTYEAISKDFSSQVFIETE